MKRNIAALTQKEFDLIIIGGGIFGCCAAWDAALRGLSVALLERGDFSAATSANHYKIVHGGIRYLQHGDVYRARESSKERNVLLRIAPHLVKPLPIVLPTYGYGMKGKGILGLGMGLYDLLVWDRNKGIKDSLQRIPRGKLISREECLRLYPGLEKEGLTGAAVFSDGQMYNPPRLAMSYLRSAVSAGAEIANYMEVNGFLQSKNRVFGVEATDITTGQKTEIRGKIILNAAGPWAEQLLNTQKDIRLNRQFSYSRDACVVVRRPFAGESALAVSAKTSDPDAILSRGNRHIFITPWRNYTLIGVWHKVHHGDPNTFTVTEKELEAYLDEVNAAYPSLELSLSDISRWNAGLVLFGENKSDASDLSFGKRSQIIDHAKDYQLEGLVTLIGIRATTSRVGAEKAIDLVSKKLGKQTGKSQTDSTPIFGGNIECKDTFFNTILPKTCPDLEPEVMKALGHNYGSEFEGVMDLVKEDPSLGDTVGSSLVLKAEIIHAIRFEMAQKLADVALRRTDLATGEYPGEEVMQSCGDIMAKELGWNKEKTEKEIQEIRSNFPKHVFAPLP